MNQRKRTRVSARKEATIVRGGAAVHAEVVNLSLKGCLLEVDEAFAARSREAVSVVIHLEPDAPEFDIKVQGRIVRAEEGSIAIEFTEIALESFKHLVRLVQYNADEPDEIEQELGTSAFTPPA
ncbi:MAG: PilZ domain-containing protein [Deltaproteobacteria bacterium]|nr:PilZ domain-containing protein [Deltaproteobacteria bacterium]